MAARKRRHLAPLVMAGATFGFGTFHCADVTCTLYDDCHHTTVSQGRVEVEVARHGVIEC